MAAFELELNAKFDKLFQDFQKVVAILKQVQTVSREASAQIQNDFQKSSAGTAQFNSSFQTLGNLLGSLSASLGPLNAIGDAIKTDGVKTNEFTANLETNISVIKELANTAIQEASQFNDLSDEKQRNLQQEVETLQQLQVESRKANDPESAKVFNGTIQSQINKVQELTQEIKKTVFPVQEDPFKKADDGIDILTGKVLEAQSAAKEALDTFGEWSPEFQQAKQELEKLQQGLELISKPINIDASVTGVDNLGFEKQTENVKQFKSEISAAAKELDKFTLIAINEGAKFTDATNQKEVTLQHEILKLKELKTLQQEAPNLEGQKKFTLELANQTGKVIGLIAELKGISADDLGFKNAGTSVIALRTQITNAKNEAALALRTFGQWSPEFRKASTEVARLQEIQNNLNKTAQAFNPEERLQGLSNVIRGVVGGFSAVQGALAALGVGGDDIARSLQKIQGLMLFTQGINEVLTLGTTFKALALQLGITTTATKANIIATGQQKIAATATTGAIAAETIATEGATVATQGFTAALLANPLTAVLVALLAVGAAVYYFAQQSEDAADAQKKLTSAGEDEVNMLKELDFILTKVTRDRILAIEQEIKLAQAQKQSPASILLLEKTLAEERLRLSSQQIQNLNLSEDKLKSLTESYRKSTVALALLQDELRNDPTNDDLKKRVDAQAGYVSFLKSSLQDSEKAWNDYSNAVTGLLAKNAEIDIKKAEEIFNAQKALLESQIAIDKVGTDEKVKHEKQLVELQKNFAVQNIENQKKLLEQNTRNEIEQNKIINTQKINRLIEFRDSITGNSDFEIEQRRQLNKDIGELEKGNVDFEIEQQKLLNAQITKLRTDAKVQVNKIDTDAAIKRIEDEKQLNLAQLTVIQKNSEEELNLKLKIIDEEVEQEKLKITVTDKEKLAFIIKSEKEKSDLRKGFAQKNQDAELEIEKSVIEQKLSIVQAGSEQELQLKKEAIELQVVQEILTIQRSEETEKVKQAKIKSINAKADRDKKDLDNEAAIREIDLATDVANHKIELINLELKARLADPNLTASARLAIEKQIAANEGLIIQNSIKANEDKRKAMLITDEDYVRKKMALETAGAENTNKLNKIQVDVLKQSYLDAAEVIKNAFDIRLDGLNASLAVSQSELSHLKNLLAEDKDNIALAKAVKRQEDYNASLEKTIRLNKIVSENIGKLTDDFLKLAETFKTEGKTTEEIFLSISTAANTFIQDIGKAVNAALQAQLDNLIQQRENNDEFISLLQSQIDEKQSQIDQDLELNAKGVANNLDLHRAEQAELKKQKDAALAKDREIAAQQKKIQKEMAVVNAAQQASSLLLAVAKIIEAHSTIPFVGVAIAAGLIAGMFAIFLGTKAKIQEASQLREGGEIDLRQRRDHGMIRGRKHEQQGGHRIEGTNIYVEHGEYVSTARATEKHHKLLEAINKDKFETISWKDILALPGIKFPELEAVKLPKTEINKESIERITTSKSELKTLEISHAYSTSTAGTEKELKELREDFKKFKKRYFGKAQVHILPNGSIMTIEGNTTRIVKPHTNDKA